MSTGIITILGSDVWHALELDKLAKVPASHEHPGCFQSEPLCQWQSEKHAEGYTVAQLHLSNLGWSLRHRSGLDGFRLIASTNDGTLDGTWKAALDFATVWQANRPNRRCVIVHQDDYAVACRQVRETVEVAS